VLSAYAEARLLGVCEHGGDLPSGASQRLWQLLSPVG
jgi:hypothetical protein